VNGLEVGGRNPSATVEQRAVNINGDEFDQGLGVWVPGYLIRFRNA
jgi:hypothetical protein